MKAKEAPSTNIIRNRPPCIVILAVALIWFTNPGSGSDKQFTVCLCLSLLSQQLHVDTAAQANAGDRPRETALR